MSDSADKGNKKMKIEIIFVAIVSLLEAVTDFCFILIFEALESSELMLSKTRYQ